MHYKQFLRILVHVRCFKIFLAISAFCCCVKMGCDFHSVKFKQVYYVNTFFTLSLIRVARDDGEQTVPLVSNAFKLAKRKLAATYFLAHSDTTLF